MRRLLLILSICMILIPTTTFAQDTDSDGVADSVDNCPSQWNPRIPFDPPYNIQPDADGDGIGNVCDECTDQDGDGFGDPGFPWNTCPEDNCPGLYNPTQLDSDGDGVGDACEGYECGDVDGDGVGGHILDATHLFEFMWFGGKSPVCQLAANSAGCPGLNIYDLIFTHGDPYQSWTNCEEPSSCDPVDYGAVSLDRVDGVMGGDTIATGQQVRFYIRLTGNDTSAALGLTNGFRVYSPSGAAWGAMSTAELVDFYEPVPRVFTNVRSVYHFGVTGSGADTLALGYVDIQGGTGILPGFDSVTHVIEIGPVPHEFTGGEICLDSCWYPPCGEWMWAYHGPNSEPYAPSWDGPHCFTVVRCCDPRGDIDHSGIGPDIADLVYLVSYMFQDGPAPLCPEKADINGDSIGPDIADLVYLVTFMFQNGPPPAPCE